MNLKKNAPLIVSFVIPLVMILFVAASVYLPQLFLKPQYNFLYTGSNYYYSEPYYVVIDRKLVENSHVLNSESKQTKPQLYLYNVKTNESTLIDYEEVKAFVLDPSYESPDGYRLEQGSSSGGFFPFYWSSDDYNATYITGHTMSRKLRMKTDRPYSYNSTHFLGWIIQ